MVVHPNVDRNPLLHHYVILIATILLFATLSQIHAAEEPAGKAFLRWAFGNETVDVSKICLPNADLWMLPGKRDERAIKNIDAIPDNELTNAVAQGVIMGTERPNLYFFETKDGRIDARPYLDVIYRLHRELVLRFVIASLSQNQRILERISNDATKIKFSGPKAQPAEMGQYEDIIQMFPVLRSSDPKADAQSKSITYRVPLGTNNLSLKLTKSGNTWKVDTSTGVTVPTWTFFK